MPHGDSIADRQPDDHVRDQVRRWVRSFSATPLGKLEFARQSYLVKVVGRPEQVERLLANLGQDMVRQRKTGCLLAFSAQSSSMFEGATLRWGEQGISLTVKCPVIDIDIVYNNFEAIGICPQQADGQVERDRLFPPVSHCMIKLASDSFGFASFVRATALANYGRLPCDLDSIHQLEHMFEGCIDAWHGMAEATVRSLMHGGDTRTYASWFPMSPGRERNARMSTRAAVKQWMAYFRDGVVPDRMSGTPPGHPS